jgi:hypothetical protein
MLTKVLWLDGEIIYQPGKINFRNTKYKGQILPNKVLCIDIKKWEKMQVHESMEFAKNALIFQYYTGLQLMHFLQLSIFYKRSLNRILIYERKVIRLNQRCVMIVGRERKSIISTHQFRCSVIHLWDVEDLSGL